jgi:hypothetical protein
MALETIKQRGAGRTQAKDCIQFLEDMAETLTDEGRAAYWDELREYTSGKCPSPKQTSTSSVVGMSDKEAREFGQQEMPFGKHKGMLICNVPLPYFDWLNQVIEK